MTKQSIPIINHYTALVSYDDFNDESGELEAIAELITERLKLTVVEKMLHSFEPEGKTLVLILAESHLLLHTWPEYKTVHIDIVSCSKLTGKEFLEAVRWVFRDKINLEVKWES